jgi:peptidoglycan/LPS O-acetylase OafA/YrhL
MAMPTLPDATVLPTRRLLRPDPSPSSGGRGPTSSGRGAASRAPSTAAAPPPIAALTGLRAVAAVWVVAFHYRDDLLALAPALRPLEPLMSSGYLGVDVFFVLSGFVLAYNYAGRLGRWAPREACGFVRNRVARVWPVHVATLHLDLLVAWAVGALGVTAGGHQRTPAAYLQNLTMTHQWFTDRSSFNAPAWSISAEWAAYLACPLLLLALARVRRPGTAGLLAVLAYASMLGVFAAWARPDGNVPHAGLLRVAVEFAAGVLLLRVHQHLPRRAGALALPWAAAVVVVLLLVPVARTGYWLAPAFAVLTLLLASGAAQPDQRQDQPGGLLGRLLATRWFGYWGEASYCLYMTHLLLLPVLHRVIDPTVAAGAPWPVGLVVLVGYAGALAAAAVALRRLVEVPARRALRARG